MPFTPVTDGDLAIAPSIQQIIDAMQGVTGAGQAVSLTSLDSSTSPSLALQNLDTTYGWALHVFSSSGASLLDIRDSTTTFDNGTLVINNATNTVTIAGSLYTQGPIFDLDSFAGGVAINAVTATTEALQSSILTATNTAWAAAFAAVTAAGGGTIRLSAGTYLAPQTALGPEGYSGYGNVGALWPSNMTIVGQGMYATTILHRTLQNSPPINGFGATKLTVMDLAINGNYDTYAAMDDTQYALGTGWGGSSAEINVDTKYVGLTASTYATYGNDNRIERVRVYNFWNEAIRAGGERNIVKNCRIVGNAPSTYIQNTYGVACVAPRQYTQGGSTVGITANYVYCRNIRIEGNEISGLRSAAIFGAGDGLRILNNTMYDNHRGVDSGGFPGGNTGLSTGWNGTTFTVDGSGNKYPNFAAAYQVRGNDIIIAGNTIRGLETALGGGKTAQDGGIEVDGGNGILIADNVVDGPYYFGISVNASGAAELTREVDLSNNHVANITGALNGGGVGLLLNCTGAGASTKGVVVDGGSITGCLTAIQTAATGVSHYSFDNLTLKDNTVQWTKSGSEATWSSGSTNKAYTTAGTVPVALPHLTYHNWGSGTVANLEEYGQVIKNVHVSGNGMWLWGGSSASNYAFRLSNYTGGSDLLSVFGNGQITGAADLVSGSAYSLTNSNATSTARGLSIKSQARPLTLNVADNSAAIRLVEEWQEANTTKFFFGLDATDLYTMYDSAGTGALMTISPTTGQTFHHSTNAFPMGLNSTAAASVQGLTIQRSASSKAIFGIDASDNPTIFNGSSTALLTADKTTGQLSGLGLTWTAFTPTLTQNGASITVTVNLARYLIVGKMATIQVKLTYSSGATGAAAIIMTLPAALTSKTTLVAGAGQFIVYDSSAVKYYSGWPQITGTTTVTVVGVQNNDGGAIGASPAFQLAAGDEIYLSMTWETN